MSCKILRVLKNSWFTTNTLKSVTFPCSWDFQTLFYNYLDKMGQVLSNHVWCLHGPRGHLGWSPLGCAKCKREWDLWVGATHVDPGSSHPGLALVTPHCATLWITQCKDPPENQHLCWSSRPQNRRRKAELHHAWAIRVLGTNVASWGKPT